MGDYLIDHEDETLQVGYFNPKAFEKHKKSICVLKTAIAGLRYHINEETIEGNCTLEDLQPGTELFLFREPENTWDEWAIAVYTSADEKIGYVTRFKNETIARLMDCGKVFHAYVDKYDDAVIKERINQLTSTEDYTLPFSVYMDD